MTPALSDPPEAMVGPDDRARFEREGFCLLPGVIPPNLLAILRDECQGFIDRKHAEMDAVGTDTVGISHRGRRYFVSDAWRQRPVLGRFLFSPLMAGICRDLLGPDAWLFYDQYVVKGTEAGGTSFAWHQDSGYVNANGGDATHRPYLTCWCTLDDVTEANGTVYLLPYEAAGTRQAVPHRKDPETNDWVGYFGAEPGVPVELPAGSVACFSSTAFHRSGSNRSPAMRRVFLAQYSAEPILDAGRGRVWAQAEPFLEGGRVVARAAA
jgi:hypothetical protein